MTKTATALFAAALSFTLWTSCAKKDSGLAAGPEPTREVERGLYK